MISMPGFLRLSEHRRRPTGQQFKATHGPDLVRTKLEFSLAVQLLRISTLRKSDG